MLGNLRLQVFSPPFKTLLQLSFKILRAEYFNIQAVVRPHLDFVLGPIIFASVSSLQTLLIFMSL